MASQERPNESMPPDRFSRIGSACTLLLAALAGPADGQVIQRVSLTSAGHQVFGESFGASISGDGRYVAFYSFAENLVSGDSNGFLDVFVRDRLLGTTERVSVDSVGGQGNEASFNPSISGDGRYVAFLSDASNLVSGDTNDTRDVFVRDRLLGTTERVDVDSTGAQANGWAESCAISADGRYVAFHGNATNLVAGDTNGYTDVFVRDRGLGTTERVSVHSSGAEGDSNSFYPSISADGRFVGFYSLASTLVDGDANGWEDVFLHDRQMGTTELISLDSSGMQGNSVSAGFSVSADGRFVAFGSFASNLVSGDTNGSWDGFVRDRQLGTTERVTVSSSGLQATGTSSGGAISPDGRYVVFGSDSSNLVVGDNNFAWDVFIRDRQLGTTTDLSGGGNDDSSGGSISADGRYVAFQSDATNLVTDDTNEYVTDIFVHDRFGGPNFTSLCDPGFDGVVACPCGNPPSGPGRGCDNSSGTGGAILTAGGGTILSSDSLVFTTSGEKPTATSVLLQGTSSPAAGVVYGQGVRCVGGTLKRLFTKTASSGSVTVPSFPHGDPTVSARSAAKGNPISAGQSRWYLVFYRDPIVLGGCPSGSTFNATQTGLVSWSP